MVVFGDGVDVCGVVGAGVVGVCGVVGGGGGGVSVGVVLVLVV